MGVLAEPASVEENRLPALRIQLGTKVCNV